ncbi:hypothetical protein F5Y15DRAFT_41564 [Xylariaceae sp. FL0016]|nr:hypothetical protein F5Y15DRAFT_41564 [Xylariaceae sp. FL0016]
MSSASKQSTARFRNAPLDLNFPLRDQHELPKLGVDTSATISRPWTLDNQISDSLAMESQALSPTGSSCGSSFSQASSSSADSGSTAPTEPPTPTLPIKKQKSNDTLPFISISRRCSLKRKDDASDEMPLANGKRIKLPSVHYLLNTPRETPRTCSLPSRSIHALRTPSTSPEPSSEYIYSGRPSMFGLEDPITRSLNMLRKSRNQTETDLSPPQGLCETAREVTLEHINQPIFFRTPDYSPVTHTYPYRPSRQQPSPPREVKKQRARPKTDTHCNIKYSVEETDFIRYYNRDLKRPWEFIKMAFAKRFPDAPQRRTQGIQGVAYRENKGVPRIETSSQYPNGLLKFQSNGHVECQEKKVRQQGDNKWYFGLVYLYPERAIAYPWVCPEDRERAARILKDRIPQKERARRHAMEQGKWVEKIEPPGSCGCCAKEDRERDGYRRNYPRSTFRDVGHGLPQPKL